ncbi:MAG: carboxymuconolactone decarboxylase family protein [Oscillospiraceae bacterium]|nr:carboxymuconolactone decarboxylase family protein [Oscillospiraceae bacterium]
MAEKIVQTAGRDQLGAFAPDFAHFNDDILFGENWNNTDIDLKTRSIITVVALMSQGVTDNSIRYHIQNAKNHGVSQREMAAVITHTAFYAGWPHAWAVFNIAKEVYADNAPAVSDKDKFQSEIMFPIGDPNPYGDYFVGQSYLAPVSTEQIPIYNVTFEPACRNNWHIHHAKSGGGQMLICIGGRGWYQEYGKEARELNPGDIVNIPAEIKHWHGAAKDSWFAHLAVEIQGEDCNTEWCEAVSDDEYGKLK